MAFVKNSPQIVLLILKKMILFFVLFMTFYPLLAQEKTLKGGWYLWDPYQYVEEGKGYSKLTGLDIQLTHVIFNRIGYDVLIDPTPWKTHLSQLKTGEKDVASGATYSAERAEFSYYSKPYRQEENALYIRKGESKLYNFGTLEQTLKTIQEKQLKVGVIDGFVYADERINQFVRDPKNASLITRSENDFNNLQLLIDKRIDGLLADRLVASTAAWRTQNRNRIEEHYLGISVPIHFILSKKTTPPQMVEKLNQAIDYILNTDEYGKILRHYLIPVLLLQTTDRPWFFIIDIIGTIAFAISGVIIAYRERCTLFGAFVFAALPSIGGGTLRDIIVGRSPIGIMQTPLYIILVGLTVIVAYIVIRFIPNNVSTLATNKHMNRLFDVADALGQAAFSVSGVVIAVAMQSEPLWLWGPIFAAMTGAGGGILRDMLRSDNTIVALKGSLYAEISVLWGFVTTSLLYVAQKKIDPSFIFTTVLISVMGCFLTRVLIAFLNIQGLMFAPKKD
jgi:polar amino acid transport system substrate-binding protein